MYTLNDWGLQTTRLTSHSKHNKPTQKHAPRCLEMHVKWKQCVLNLAQNIKHAWYPLTQWNHSLMVKNSVSAHYTLHNFLWNLTAQNLQVGSDVLQLAMTLPDCKSGQKSYSVFQPWISNAFIFWLHYCWMNKKKCIILTLYAYFEYLEIKHFFSTNMPEIYSICVLTAITDNSLTAIKHVSSTWVSEHIGYHNADCLSCTNVYGWSLHHV